MRNIIIIIGIYFISTPLFSQNNAKISPVELGLGINRLTTHNGANTKIGFGLSVKKIWFSQKKLNLISGVVFEKTKYFDDYVNGGNYYHYKNMTFNIYSFSVPLMLRVNTGNACRFFLETGPSFEIIPLKYGKGIEVTYPPTSNTTETEMSGDFDHDYIDFGANVGLGFVFPVNNLKIVISSTYHNSLKYLFSNQQDELTEYLTLKLGVLIN